MARWREVPAVWQWQSLHIEKSFPLAVPELPEKRLSVLSDYQNDLREHELSVANMVRGHLLDGPKQERHVGPPDSPDDRYWLLQDRVVYMHSDSCRDAR